MDDVEDDVSFIKKVWWYFEIEFIVCGRFLEEDLYLIFVL